MEKNYIVVDHADDVYSCFISQLYLEAFPEKERRDWEVLKGMIGTVPEMKVQLILGQEKPVGFIISWELGDWCFIEHFAISAAERGKKYGESIMHDFLKDQRVLLEVEPAGSEEAVRRINFYQRLGMAPLPIHYLQPPYRPEAEAYEMVLMSNDLGLPKGDYLEIINLIFEKVYGSPRRLL